MEPADPSKRKRQTDPTLPLPEGLLSGLELDEPALPFVEPGRWVVTRELARGGMGRILEARDSVLGRTVAIKQALSRDLEAVRRFEREALVTARLQHPGIVPIYEAGRSSGGEPFFVMRLVEGRSLEAALEATTTPTDRVALLPALLAVAETVAYAHSHEIVHRDLKPANVLVGNFGDVVVVDWGLAKLTGDSVSSFSGIDSLGAHATSHGSILGTPTYMAPEQARGEDVDARTDVYALGGMLYTILAGRPPHIGASAKEVVEAVLRDGPLDIRLLAPDARGDLIAITRKAMARDPKDRYPNAAELAQDLQRFMTVQLVGARRYTVPQLVWRFAREHRLRIGLALAVLTALTMGGAAILRERNARSRYAAQFQEEGRRNIHAGRPAAAARVLIESARLAPGDSATELLLGESARVLRLHRRSERAHTGKIASMIADPARERLASSGEDGRVVFWTMRDGERIGDAKPHTEAITWSQFSRDGSRLVTASWDFTAALLDPTTARILTVFRGHVDALNMAAISPDGKLVVTAADDATVRIWDSATGAEIRVLGEHEETAWAADFLDDSRVVTLDDRGELRIFDVKTGKLLASASGGDSSGRQVVASPDGSRIATAGDDAGRLFDGNGKLLALLPQQMLWDAQFSGDSRYLVTNGGDEFAVVWDARTGARISACSAAQLSEINWARFSPDSRLLAVASSDGTVRVCAVSDGRQVVSLDGHGWGASQAEWGAGGRSLATAGDNGIVRFWDAPLLGEEWTLEGSIQHADWSPDGTRVATASRSGSMTIWDPTSGREILTLGDHAKAVSTVAWSPDSSRVVAGSFDGRARLWDARTGALLHGITVPPGNVIVGFAVGRIFVASTDGVVRWLDAATGAPLGKEQAFEPNASFSAAVSPDGRVVWSGVDAGMTADPGGSLPRLHSGEVTWIAFDPAGERFATSGYTDGTLVIWDTATLAPIRRIPSLRSSFVEFSPDGRWLAASGKFGFDIWEIETSKLLLHRDAHSGTTLSVGFSPDGRRLITTGGDSARIWRLPSPVRDLAEVARLLEPFDSPETSADQVYIKGF